MWNFIYWRFGLRLVLLLWVVGSSKGNWEFLNSHFKEVASEIWAAMGSVVETCNWVAIWRQLQLLNFCYGKGCHMGQSCGKALNRVGMYFRYSQICGKWWFLSLILHDCGVQILSWKSNFCISNFYAAFRGKANSSLWNNMMAKVSWKVACFGWTAAWGRSWQSAIFENDAIIIPMAHCPVCTGETPFLDENRKCEMSDNFYCSFWWLESFSH